MRGLILVPFFACFAHSASAQAMAEQVTRLICALPKTEISVGAPFDEGGKAWCEIIEVTTIPAFLGRVESVSSQVLFKGYSKKAFASLDETDTAPSRYLSRVCPTMLTALIDEIAVNDALMTAAELPESKEHIVLNCSFVLPVSPETVSN